MKWKNGKMIKMEQENGCESQMVVQNEPQNLPLVDVDGAVEFWEKYQELTKRLLNDSDYQGKGDNKFKKKSAWRKYAKAFNVSTTIIDEKLTKDDQGRIVTAEYIVKAWTPDGRSESGVGACSIWDKQKKEDDTPFMLRQRFSNPENDVRATGHTRAKNRAISDLIGSGEVSAEEVDFNNQSNRQRSQPIMKTRGRPNPDDQLADEVNNIIDAEIVEKKGSKPGGKSEMPPAEKVQAPWEKVVGISTALDQWVQSIKNKDTIKSKMLIEQSRKLLGTNTMSPEEMTQIREALGVK